MATLDETVMGGDTVNGLNGGLCTPADVPGTTPELTATVCEARGCSCPAELEGATTLVAAAAANFDMLSSRLLRTLSGSTSAASGRGTPNARCLDVGEDGITLTTSVDCAASPKRCFAQSTRAVGDGTIFPLVVGTLETVGSAADLDAGTVVVSAAVVFDGSTVAFPVAGSTLVVTSESNFR